MKKRNKNRDARAAIDTPGDGVATPDQLSESDLIKLLDHLRSEVRSEHTLYLSGIGVFAGAVTLLLKVYDSFHCPPPILFSLGVFSLFFGGTLLAVLLPSWKVLQLFEQRQAINRALRYVSQGEDEPDYRRKFLNKAIEGLELYFESLGPVGKKAAWGILFMVASVCVCFGGKMWWNH